MVDSGGGGSVGCFFLSKSTVNSVELRWGKWLVERFDDLMICGVEG